MELISKLLFSVKFYLCKLCSLKHNGKLPNSQHDALYLHNLFAGKIREMALDLAFSIADYAIFGIMLFISFGIGVYHASKSSKNNEEFVMGSRSFSVLPMAISLCASFNSAYMILGIPGEIYSNGTQFYIMILGTGLGVFVAAELWLPILYRIQVVSIYEYFELRYKSKFPRILMTLIFILKVCFSLRSSVCRDQFE